MKKLYMLLIFVLSAFAVSLLPVTAHAYIDTLASDAVVTTNNPAEKEQYGIDNVCDCSSLSRYVSMYETVGEYNPTYITMDFGTEITYDTFDVREYKSNITNYSVEYSTDGESWTMLSEKTKQSEGNSSLSRSVFDAVTSRYIRVCVTAAVGKLEIFELVPRLCGGSIARAPTLNKPATSSIGTYAAYSEALINDGSMATRYANPMSPSQKSPVWVQIDMLDVYDINFFSIQEYDARIMSFDLQYSTDGVSWQTAYSKQYGDNNRRKGISDYFDAVKARYVRLNIYESYLNSGATIWEFEVLYLSEQPGVSNVRIKKPDMLSKTVKGYYSWDRRGGRTEGASIYKWYRSDLYNGEYELIEAANSVEYTLTKDDCGKYLKFEIIPCDSLSGVYGTAELSTPMRIPNQIFCNTIALMVGENTAINNKERCSINPEREKCVVYKKDGEIFLPLRFIAEGLGAEVTDGDGYMEIARNGIVRTIRDTEYETSYNTAFVKTSVIKSFLHTKVFANENGLILVGDDVSECYYASVLCDAENYIKYFYDTEKLKLTADSMFAIIDLDKPELLSVKTAYKNGNCGEALELFKDYFIDKISRKYTSDISLWIQYTDTEDIMNNIVLNSHPSGTVKAYIGEPGSIDWYSYPPDDNYGWWVHLSSMFYPGNYILAFLKDGDSEYINRWSRLWEDSMANDYDAWLEVSNSTDEQYHDSLYVCWRQQLYLSWRLGNFVSQLGAAAQYSPQITKAELPGAYLSTMLTRTVEYVDNVLAGYQSGGTPNQVIESGVSLAMANSVLDDFIPATEYIDDATRIIDSYLSIQSMPDGVDYEQSFNYNGLLCEKLETIKKIYSSIEVKPSFYDELDTMNDYRKKMLELVKNSTGTGPSLRSGGFVLTPSSEANMLNRFKLAANGKAESQLDFTSFALPYGGYYALRNKWTGDDAIHLFMKGSRRGSGHYDEAGNSIQVSAFGKQMLFDGGKSGYGQLFYENYVFNSFAHNTVVVDNYSQCMSAEPIRLTAYDDVIPARWLSSESFDFTEAFYDYGYGISKDYESGEKIISDVSHNRQVIFDRKSGTFIVTDLMESDGEHDYTQIWTFNPDYTYDKFFADPASKVIKTTDTGGPNISIHNFTEKTLGITTYRGVNDGDNVFGWTNVADRIFEKIDAHFNWHGRGNQVMVSLITPSADGSDRVTASEMLDSSTENAPAFKAVLDDGTELYYTASASTAVDMSLCGVEFKGRALLVRKAADGALSGIALGGNEIKYGGVAASAQQESFEFSVNNGIVIENYIEKPQTFRWEQNENGNTIPVYND